MWKDVVTFRLWHRNEESDVVKAGDTSGKKKKKEKKGVEQVVGAQRGFSLHFSKCIFLLSTISPVEACFESSLHFYYVWKSTLVIMWESFKFDDLLALAFALLRETESAFEIFFRGPQKRGSLWEPTRMERCLSQNSGGGGVWRRRGRRVSRFFEPLHGGGKQRRNAPPPPSSQSSCPDNTSAVKMRGWDEALLRLWMTLSLGVSSIVLSRLGAESGSSIGEPFFCVFTLAPYLFPSNGSTWPSQPDEDNSSSSSSEQRRWSSLFSRSSQSTKRRDIKKGKIKSMFFRPEFTVRFWKSWGLIPTHSARVSPLQSRAKSHKWCALTDLSDCQDMTWELTLYGTLTPAVWLDRWQWSLIWKLRGGFVY